MLATEAAAAFDGVGVRAKQWRRHAVSLPFLASGTELDMAAGEWVLVLSGSHMGRSTDGGRFALVTPVVFLNLDAAMATQASA